MHDTDWRGRPLEMAQSVGGVRAFKHPWDGVVRGNVTPWPPPELTQKLYQSRQARAYRDDELTTATAALGYYSDLQSVHSEDAVTWSLFGPLVYGRPDERATYTAELLSVLLGDDQEPRPANLWLWRRLPHPDTLVPGGPEIDFGIQTERVLLLGEAKWRSQVGSAQGADGSKDQIRLRVDFCEKYGRALYPSVQRFVVLLVSQQQGALTEEQRGLASARTTVLETTWEQIGALASNPWRDEFLAQLRWRQSRSLAS